MKKFVLLLAIAGLAFGVTSCNSDSQTRHWGMGSYEYFSTPYIMNFDGTKFTAAPGSSFPVLSQDDYGSRCLMEFYYTKADESVEIGEGKSIQITLKNYARYPTFQPVGKGESEFSDPILGMYAFNGKTEINIITNVLTFIPQFFLFRENADANYYSSFAFDLEIDEELIVGDDGKKTINTWLKHDANRADGEGINLSDNNGGRIAFDLEQVAYKFGFAEDETYTIRVNYTAYEWDGYSQIDESKLVEKYVTIDWTPNKPYVEKL